MITRFTHKMHQDIDISYRFSTPICSHELTGFEDRQAALIEHIHHLRETTEGIQSSNFDGWHSDRTLHLGDPGEAIQWLVRKVSIAMIKTLQKINNTEEGVDTRLREMWANINSSGNWNMPHMHAVKWSGVIYVSGDAGEEDAADQKKNMPEGDTVFLNPVPEAAYFGQPNSVPYRFKPGTMLIFPGYLMHMVAPHKSDNERITIAFNVDFVRLESQRKPAKVKTVKTTPASINPTVEIIE